MLMVASGPRLSCESRLLAGSGMIDAARNRVKRPT
jgi:hypothetical protein